MCYGWLVVPRAVRPGCMWVGQQAVAVEARPAARVLLRHQDVRAPHGHDVHAPARMRAQPRHGSDTAQEAERDHPTHSAAHAIPRHATHIGPGAWRQASRSCERCDSPSAVASNARMMPRSALQRQGCRPHGQARPCIKVASTLRCATCCHGILRGRADGSWSMSNSTRGAARSMHQPTSSRRSMASRAGTAGAARAGHPRTPCAHRPRLHSRPALAPMAWAAAQDGHPAPLPAASPSA